MASMFIFNVVLKERKSDFVVPVTCIELYPNHLFSSEEHCFQRIQSCMEQFPNATSGDECFDILAIHDPRKDFSGCMELFPDKEFSSNLECYLWTNSLMTPSDSP